MKHLMTAILLGAALLTSPAAFAAEQTVTLSMPELAGCPSCAFIIKRVISNVDGVTQVQTAAADMIATVTYDDSRTSVEKIVQAAAERGYDAEPVSPVKGS